MSTAPISSAMPASALDEDRERDGVEAHRRPAPARACRPSSTAPAQPGPHDAGRLGELDDRRALDLGARAEPARSEHGRLDPVAVEVRAARAALGVAPRRARRELRRSTATVATSAQR